MKLAATFIFVALLTSVAPGQTTQPAMPISDVRTFMYQLQNLESPGAIDALAKSGYDMLVVEPTATVIGNGDFDMKAMVTKLHAGKPGRLVIAYLNTGQAESYRTYWGPEWKAPTPKAIGHPDFILKADPDGWTDNYNVAYWDPRWQKTLVTGAKSELRTVMAASFDGVYLDWIDAFDEEKVVAAAKAAKVDPAKAMVDLLLLIRRTVREINPNAIVIQQNAIYLLDADPRLPTAIDGIGNEDTWFGGKANAEWGTKKAGDIPNRETDEWSSPAARLKQYAKYRAAGKPVFTIDYCRDLANAAKVYEQASAAGLVPLVTQISLERMTETPPPSLGAPATRPANSN